MACGLPSRLIKLLTVSYSCLLILAVTPSTTTPVPPLQWIELTNLLSGSSPPGLKYASIGYDSSSGTLLIFGGESDGFPLQQTYLLDVSSLTWFSPNPPGAQASVKPPPRSLAISGGDFAASNRHGHLVIGGKGQNGVPLSDVWEFDYINQFWSEVTVSPGGPSARYSASGGTDPESSPISDVTVPGPNNTFYLAGGFDGETVLPLSDVWKFEMAGVLSSNLPANSTLGSWTKVGFTDTLPSRVRQAGTVMPSAGVVAVGGCSSNSSGDSCAQQDSHVLYIDSTSDISPNGCPAPRVGPVVVPNYNNFSSSFANQAFVFLGLFNETLWDDGNGLNQGEVDVLAVDTGVWTRLLPSGDPSSGTPKFPVPREGAVAISSPKALVGTNPSIGSDIIVFGGQDAQGNYLNDLWLLRSYAGSIASTNASWSGFGDGILGTGVDASGTGVTAQYLTSCAKALSPSSSSTSATPGSTSSASPTSPSSSSPGSSGNSGSANIFPFETHVSHKILSPVSVVLALAALLLYRLSLPSTTLSTLTDRHVAAFIWLTRLVGLAAYTTGVAGIALAFTTISSTSTSVLERRATSSGLSLKTNHGKAALAFFIALYGLIPALFILSYLGKLENARRAVVEPSRPEGAVRKDSNETGFTALATPGREKMTSGDPVTSSSPDVTTHTIHPDSPVSEPRSRSRSLLGGYLWSGLRTKERSGRPSYDSNGNESTSSAGPSRSFEVLNRATRARRLSANGLNAFSSEIGHTTQSHIPRSLSDLDWLGRRQNVAAFGELDYALTQLNHTHVSTPAGDSGPLLSAPDPESRPVVPPKPMAFLHVFLHAIILGLCIVTLVALWQRAPRATFIIFLLWTIAFYVVLFLLAWRGIPRSSLLTVLLNSLRYHNEAMQAPEAHASSRPLSPIASEQYAFPSNARSPYIFHQPLFRRAHSTHEDENLSSSGHRPDDEDDEDEETQQRRIEQEMDRRDVSIVTVPKRKLWIANPS